MKHQSPFGDAGRRYASAHAAHYLTCDLPLALELYKGVLASHPKSQEAEFSRTQVQNIVNAVIPRQEMLAAQMSLVGAHFDRKGSGVGA